MTWLAALRFLWRYRTAVALAVAVLAFVYAVQSCTTAAEEWGAERERTAQAQRERDAALTKADRMWTGIEALGRQVRVRTVQAARDSAGYAAARDKARGTVAKIDTAQTDSLTRTALAEQGAALDSADKALASCSLVKLDCKQRGDSLERLVHFLRDSVPAVPPVRSTPSRESHVGFGATIGYGAVIRFPRDSARHRRLSITGGPAVSAGLTLRF